MSYASLRCRHCGAPNPDVYAFCAQCGTQLARIAAPASIESALVATVAAVTCVAVILVVVFATLTQHDKQQSRQPFVNLVGKEVTGPGTFTFTVEADREAYLTEYYIIVRNGTRVVISATDLPLCIGPGSACTGEGISVWLHDPILADRLSTGDRFTVSGIDPSAAADTFEVMLCWRPHNEAIAIIRFP